MKPVSLAIFSGDVHIGLLGRMLGTIWTAEDPEPITATRFPASSTVSSQLALCSIGP
jgi:hypothetical protein